MSSSAYSNCQSCGSHLTPDDFLLPACRFCGAAFRHHQEAAAKVAELHAVMGMMRGPSPPGVVVNPAHAVVVPGMNPIQHASVPYAQVPQAFAPAASPPLGPPPVYAAARNAGFPILAVVIGVTVALAGLVVLGAAVAMFLMQR